MGHKSASEKRGEQRGEHGGRKEGAYLVNFLDGEGSHDGSLVTFLVIQRGKEEKKRKKERKREEERSKT